MQHNRSNVDNLDDTRNSGHSIKEIQILLSIRSRDIVTKKGCIENRQKYQKRNIDSSVVGNRCFVRLKVYEQNNYHKND